MSSKINNLLPKREYMGDYQNIIKELNEDIELYAKDENRGDWGTGVMDGLKLARTKVIEMMEKEMDEIGHYYEKELKAKENDNK